MQQSVKRLTRVERLLIASVIAVTIFGIFTTLSAAQSFSQEEVQRNILRLEKAIEQLQLLLATNTAEDSRVRQEGFTRLAVLESHVVELRGTAQANRNFIYGIGSVLMGNIVLGFLTFNRVRNGRGNDGRR